MRDPEQVSNPVLTALGVLLVGAGGYGLARGYGAFGSRQADEPVLNNDVREFVSTNEGWFWPVAVLVALAVAWLGWRWLRHQLAGDHVSRIDLTERAGGHPAYLQATAAAAALSRDVETYPGVRSAKARLLGDGDRPAISLTVVVDDGADVTAVSNQVDAHAVPRLRQALEVDDVATSVRFHFAEPTSRR